MQKVIIENFGPIKIAEIEIRPITVVIGEQASGKSYLSKIVYFFNKLPIELFDFVYSQDNKISNEDFKSETEKIFKTTFKSLDVNKQDFDITFYYETGTFIRISNEQNRIDIVSNVFETLTTKTNEIISKRNNYKIKFPGSDGWEPKFFENFSKFFNKKYQDYNKHREIYIPAGRALLNAFPKDITYDILRNPLLSEDFIGFIRRVERIKQEFINNGGSFDSISEIHQGYYNEDVGEILLTIIQQILKAKYSGDENGEKLIFNNTKFVTIENASSGQQESLRVLQDLFLLFIEGTSGFRAIEEPEAHLFPTAQKKLIEFISIIANSTASSLFISTHSPYILSAFNNLLFAKGVEKEFGSSFSDNMSNDDNTHLPIKSAWIDPDNFIAYSLKAGDKCSLIFDIETGMIDENYLDDVSMEIGDEFNIMFEIYKKLKQ
jgi:predicted ATPase